MDDSGNEKERMERLILKLVLAETVYSIWRARNDVIFNKTLMAHDIVSQLK